VDSKIDEAESDIKNIELQFFQNPPLMTMGASYSVFKLRVARKQAQRVAAFRIQPKEFVSRQESIFWKELHYRFVQQWCHEMQKFNRLYMVQSSSVHRRPTCCTKLAKDATTSCHRPVVAHEEEGSLEYREDFAQPVRRP
jgi:hypothetical protein